MLNNWPKMIPGAVKLLQHFVVLCAHTIYVIISLCLNATLCCSGHVMAFLSLCARVSLFVQEGCTKDLNSFFAMQMGAKVECPFFCTHCLFGT